MRRRSRVFIDTNVLVYFFDESEPIKCQKARQLLAEFGQSVVLSTQVLQEFYSVVTKKRILSAHEAREACLSLEEYEVVGTNSKLVSQAINISILDQISIWDALIVQAATVGNCDRILTEDLNHGQVIKGVRIENPFLTTA